MCLRRSSLPWKSFALVSCTNDLKKLDRIISPARKSSLAEPGLVFVFTGQGAQWAGMGKELNIFPVFQTSLQKSEKALSAMGCPWKLQERLEHASSAELRSPELSQPLCTALQIALVDLLASFNVFPVAVVGHSSGEIAAAYSASAVSAKAALKIAYFRGLLSNKLDWPYEKQSSVISIGLSEADALYYIEQVRAQIGDCDLTVACINSSQNVTVSGRPCYIDALEAMLRDKEVFARKLEVQAPYHSPYMSAISDDYRAAMQELENGIPARKNIIMFSSVTGERISSTELSSAEYWVSNMVQPVNFFGATSSLLSYSTQHVKKKLDLSHRNLFRADMLIEIGPHSALRGPLNEILLQSGKATLPQYAAILKRTSSATQSLLDALGQMHCIGYPINMAKVNGLSDELQYTTLAHLPGYNFDHSRKYWDKPRIGESYRTESQGKIDLLGKPILGWNDLDPCWRNHIRLHEMPWMEDHVINSTIIYPGAGMLSMVVEAANQLTSDSPGLTGFEIKDVSFLRWLNISRDTAGTETSLSMRLQSVSMTPLRHWSEFRLSTHENGSWTECCLGFVRATYKRSNNAFDAKREEEAEVKRFQAKFASVSANCHRKLDCAAFYCALNKSGLRLGPRFHNVVSGAFDDQYVTAEIKLYEWPGDEYPQPHVIHPTTLDSIFHAATASYIRGGQKHRPLMVPTFLKKLVVSKTGLSFPEHKSVKQCAWTQVADARTADYSGFTMSCSQNTVLLRFDGLRLTNVAEYGEHATSQSFQTSQPAYPVEYLPLSERLVLEAVKDTMSPEVLGVNSACKTMKQAVLVCNSSSQVQRAVAETIRTYLQNLNLYNVEVASLEEIRIRGNMENAIFISLLELDQPFFYRMAKKEFDLMHHFLSKAKDVLWINLSGGENAGKPEYAMINGLSRSLGNERPDLRMTIIAFEAEGQLSQNQHDSLFQLLLERHVNHNAFMIDTEYVQLSGQWHVARVTPAENATDQISLRTSKEINSIVGIKDASPLKLCVGQFGLLDSLHFVHDNAILQPIEDDDVEIETSAIGMNFKDCLVALGQLPYANMGQECAGIVRRAGASTGFHCGDRVVMVATEAFKTFSRGKAWGAFKIPDSMSFATAVIIPTQFGTAGEVIHRIARMQRGETILIHSGAGGTGQALIQIARSIGAGAIFATVGSAEKMRLLRDTYQIPEEHIFYSRDSAFSKGVLRATDGRGVDVVVNSLVGDALTASWECVAPYGRFVEIGRKDILANSNLPMFAFRNNTSFHAFDGSLWLEDRPHHAHDDIKEIIAMFTRNELHPPRPLRVLDISETEQAFRIMQEGNSAGKIVLTIDSKSQVQVSTTNHLPSIP